LAAENNLILFDDVTRVNPRKITANTMHRTIDSLFLSLAECFKDRAIAIILSGADGDGAAGAIEVYKNGGRLIVQSPSSSLFKTMPQAAIREDHPIFVDRPEMLAGKIEEMINTIR
jgi:chemotaxis response regulator CheB